MALVDIFLETAVRHPEAVALEVGQQSVLYGDLQANAARIAHYIQAASRRSNALCGVLGAGTTGAFDAILGVLMAGRGYVPLNPAFPTSRTAMMITAANIDTLIVDSQGESLLQDLVGHLSEDCTVLLPHASDAEVALWNTKFGADRVAGQSALTNSNVETITRHDNDIAYVMFTSGSTGKPKGVMVSNGNIVSFVETMRSLYDIGPGDRCSQMFDLTFDLSLFDMFVTWDRGATLCVVPLRERMAPARFIRTKGLTVWFSVPAVAGFMRQLKMLKAGAFPTLRYSIFCGEPLPSAVAQDWQAAAPASRVDNLYGPTELTVACTVYHWHPDESIDTCVNGVVPIGREFAGLQTCVVDGALHPVARGSDGELCVRGPQTTLGYWENQPLSAERFVAMPWYDGPNNRWYRTGDVVREIDDGSLVFIGRVDNQVKILGYRVELGEIEARLREHGDTDFAIAIPWPQTASGASGVVACVSGCDVPDDQLLDACRSTLPDYMVPKRVIHVETMPLNSNGKIDRNQLRKLVEDTTRG